MLVFEQLRFERLSFAAAAGFGLPMPEWKGSYDSIRSARACFVAIRLDAA
jgi:hypothetical protein